MAFSFRSNRLEPRGAGIPTLACLKPLVQIALGLLAAIALLFGALYWVLEVTARIRDVDSTRRAYETVVRPATDWVRAFRQQYSRFPTDSELDRCATTNWPGFSVGFYHSPPTWQHTWGLQGTDFMVYVHTGEWNLFRQSWDGKEWKAWIE